MWAVLHDSFPQSTVWKGREVPLCRNLTDKTSARPSQPTPTLPLTAWPPDVRWRGMYFSSAVKSRNPSFVRRETAEQSQWRDILQPPPPDRLLQTVKGTKHMEGGRNDHSREQPEETGRLNVLWCLGWDPGTEQWQQGKTEETWRKGLSDNNVLLWSYSRDKCVLLPWELSDEAPGGRGYGNY